MMDLNELSGDWRGSALNGVEAGMVDCRRELVPRSYKLQKTKGKVGEGGQGERSGCRKVGVGMSDHVVTAQARVDFSRILRCLKVVSD